MNAKGTLVAALLSMMAVIAASGCIELQKAGDDGFWIADLGTDEGFVEVRCEIALTEEEQRRGLMFREELGGFDGMLFVLDPPKNITIWMKDTKLPLDIIFISPMGTVSSIVELPPGWGLPDEEVPRCSSPGPVSYVLEVNRGFCRENRVRVGATVTIHDDA